MKTYPDSMINIRLKGCLALLSFPAAVTLLPLQEKSVYQIKEISGRCSQLLE